MALAFADCLPSLRTFPRPFGPTLESGLVVLCVAADVLDLAAWLGTGSKCMVILGSVINFGMATFIGDGVSLKRSFCLLKVLCHDQEQLTISLKELIHTNLAIAVRY